MIPKTPSAWILLFIRSNAPWMLSRLSTTSSWICVSSRLSCTTRLPCFFLQHWARKGHPSQFSQTYSSSVRPYLFARIARSFRRTNLLPPGHTREPSSSLAKLTARYGSSRYLGFFYGLFKHGELHILLHIVFFAVEIIVVGTITGICGGILRVFSIIAVEFLH